ncbi:DNA glycosylase, partial [Cystobasidium minutum MCA 4210]|uniref:DNA glycosylase n=1 Tax=Cystobasidium minutum MCA 4210 TaxID=1397322 RepID=UPI0034CFF9B7
RYGLIQEELQDNLYYLMVQSILWNQTWGRSARPVLDAILTLYPTPDKMANASLPELTLMIYPIGLHNRRAKRLIDLAQVWLDAPPCKERRYRKDDPREGWEIAHLPGIGAYALDSYRIFHRDKLRQIAPDAEPEWKRVVATDKELRAWLIWRWHQEGYHYDILSGKT